MVGWGVCVTGFWCPVRGASSFPMPIFASPGGTGDVGKSSQLALVQGAELATGLGWYLGAPLIPLVGMGNCGRPPSCPLGMWWTRLPLALEIRICSPQLFLSLTSLWGALGSCSCYTALVMPCHSSVAMTLQCPCNDTGLKTGCPSQTMSTCSWESGGGLG